MRVLVAVSLMLALAGAAMSADRGPAAETGPAPMARGDLPARVPGSAAALFLDTPNPLGASVAGQKTPATLRAVLLMCDFADSLMFGRWGQVPGDFPPPMQGEILYAAHDSVFFDHLGRDVTEYFHAVSGGAFTLDVTVHGRVVNLPRPMAWYGDAPDVGEQPVALARDVMDSLASEVDFGLYDTVILVHAGAGEETDVLGDSPEQIYSTYLDPEDLEQAVADGDLPEGGLPGGIGHVLVLPECEYQDAVPPYGNGMYGSLGVYCYEVGLRLGMLPLTDFTPAGHPDSQGIGTLGLMGYGLFVYAGWSPPLPCAFNRALMGWQDAATVAPGERFMLAPAERVGDAAALARVDIAPQEYWLLEYRLQDPDGDRFWSFSGDLNGNFRRDFYDASTADGVPAPGAKFDPAEDVREWLTGAEWDHFMTENGATVPGLGGGGSGVYVWHVDEAVITAALEPGSDGANADASHKGVDLEEADGIQDLDSSAPTRWFLGADDDPYRAGGAEFGPGTLPSTETAAGVPTGLRIFDFGSPLLDPRAYVIWTDGVDTLWGQVAADTLGFRVARQEVGGPERLADLVLPAGVDLAGSAPLVVDLDATAGGDQEIVLGDHAGGVWALRGDLTEYVDRDGDPATVAPLVTGVRGGQPAAWILPAAAGDLDFDAEPEIVLTAPDGIYAFNADGTSVRSAEAGAVGLYRSIGAVLLPPVLVPTGSGRYGDVDVPVAVAVVTREADGVHLRLYQGADAHIVADRRLGDLEPAALPVLAFGRLWMAASDTAAGTQALLGIGPAQVMLPEDPEVLVYPLPAAPGSWPVAWGVEDSGGPPRWVGVAGRDGGGMTVELDEDLAMVAVRDWDADILACGPPAPGGAWVTDGAFGCLTRLGDWLSGWPRRPWPAIVPPVSAAAAPGALALNLVGQDSTLAQFVFTAADGRLFAYRTAGEPLADWPVAGPGAAAGTPAAGRLGGGPPLDLVTVGSFARVTGFAADGRTPTTEAASRISVFGDVADGGPWTMAGGSPWRCGAWDAAAWLAPPLAADGEGLVAGSHICFPSPLTSGPLRVRASARTPGRARAYVYNLEGEAVATSGWRDVPVREPFTLDVDLGSAASGLYVCRLVFEGPGGTRDQSVRSFAVVR